MRRRIGIDVGGTNTDAVLLEDDGVAAAVKTPTTPDVTTGITKALAALVAQAPGARAAQAVMIGTTHFTNAVVQRRDLAPTTAVRLGLPATASLPHNGLRVAAGREVLHDGAMDAPRDLLRQRSL